MNKQLFKLQPLLLRPFETLTGDEVSYLVNGYEKYGREAFEEWLKKEKQTRCYASLVLSHLDIADKEYWKEVHQEYTSRNKSILELLKPIFEDFHSRKGRSLCVYENFGAVLSSGESLGCFASGDVDLTVNASEEDLAIEVLTTHGFIKEERDEQAKVYGKIILRFFNQSVLNGKGFWLNIMRKPLIRNYMLVQQKYIDRLERTRDVESEFYKDTDIRVLSPIAMIYYNALHFAVEHHYSASPGMALCCDMDRVIRNRNKEIDWNKLAQWSKEDEAGLRVRLALDICNYFLKTPCELKSFKAPTKKYQKLRSQIINEKEGTLVSQDGKLTRLKVELMSDDMPLLFSVISRIWRR